MASMSPSSLVRPTLLIAGIMLIASNLRAPVTGVAPVLDMLRADLGLSAAAAGMLTTLPLLAFAAVSPLAAIVARRTGLERALLGALLALLAGLCLRSAGSTWALFAGTIAIGSGIAFGNVLLPSLVKRDFPQRIATLTSSYALVMGIASGAASFVAVPLANWQAGPGWPLALFAPALLVVLSLAVWLPSCRAGRRPVPLSADSAAPRQAIWKSWLAWQITLFLGINSLIYYSVAGWLPSMLHDAGYSATETGSIHGLLQLASAVAGLLLIPLMRRMRDQRALACGVAMFSVLGLSGLLLAPQWATLWTLSYGFGSGASIILGLAFVSLRARDALQAAALSGMAQALGYLLAAGGPTAIGALHDSTGGWTAALAACIVCACAQIGFGLGAGRNRHVG
ncbi:MFS transporter [Pigmentiphaga humi]|nr:MFS transporter [Pigmentiphaga humi]